MTMYRVFYRAAIKVVTDRRAEYDAEVEAWYSEGDGRSPEWVDVFRCDLCGVTVKDVNDHEHETTFAPMRINIGGKGHTFPRCIHGTSRWTDYDNICGGCEDPLTILQEAQYLARDWCNEFQRRTDWVRTAPADLPFEIAGSLTEWAMAPLKPLEVLNPVK